MVAKILKMIEAHVEKGVVALAALFLGYVFVFHFVGSPNRVEFAGTKLGPRDLGPKVLEEAKRLKAAMSSATDTKSEEKTPEYAKQLRETHAAGIYVPLTPDGPALQPSLRATANLGTNIEVPGLQEVEEPPGSVTLVTPLKPSQPVLSAGRGVVVPRVVRLSDEPTVGGTTPTEPTPTETAWVSVATYFNKKAQYDEMVKAKYALYRAKVYVVGLDVERQEMGPDGRFAGEWSPVTAKAAMPTLEIPEPAIDDQSGALQNREPIDRAFKLVQQNQDLLLQPPFLTVQDGDDWEMPPLPGHVDESEDEEEEDSPKPRVKKQEPRPTAGGRAAPSAGGRFGGGPSLVGGGRGGRSPAGGGGGSGEDDQRGELRKQATEDLKEAREKLKDKDWPGARDAANRVLTNPEAREAQKSEAEKVVAEADKEAQKAAAATGGPGLVGGRSGGRFVGAGGATGAAAPSFTPQRAIDLIENPETKEPAAWFHDDTVEAGKTYRYRARVKLWNRYVGRMKALSNPEQARQAITLGEWSLPSDPITVPAASHFFVRGAKFGTPLVSMEVFKWQAGAWLKQLFDLGAGDIIGESRSIRSDEKDDAGKTQKISVDFATNAVILDVRPKETVRVRLPGKEGAFTYREQESLVVVYLDPADGQVKQRVQALDLRDPLRKRLAEE